MNETIYTQEPGKYHVQKTVDGWVVVFISDRNTMRNVDGGKVHKNRQNAYAKAKRLNDALTQKYQEGDLVTVTYPDDGSTEEVKVVRYAAAEFVTIHHTQVKQSGYVSEFDTSVPEKWLSK